MQKGTKDNPWQLKTAPGTAEYTMYRDEEKSIIVCKVGTTTLHYDQRCIDDLHAMLKRAAVAIALQAVEGGALRIDELERDLSGGERSASATR